ncbi:MAG TPA: hypothetical protein VJ793_09520 [Anaerolineae bacterium]|nr:hypothetical protein [Anaerolineae bacterium]
MSIELAILIALLLYIAHLRLSASGKLRDYPTIRLPDHQTTRLTP